MNEESVVRVKSVGKSFGATRALDDVTCEFQPGQITALVGANGAGKSTLIKIICGYYPDYEGSVFVGGGAVRYQNPSDAYRSGIQTVHQSINQGVVQNMTVAENLALNYMLSTECDLIVKREQILERARRIAEPMGLGHLDLNMKVERLSQSDRQLIIIARAIASEPKLLILDEPTSSISERETEILFEKLMMLRARGVAILYVSHRLHEIKRIADRVFVIRDGRVSATLEKPFDVKQIVTAMVGAVKEREARAAKSAGEPILEIRGLVAKEGKKPLDLTVRRGEVLGITGLIGAGKSELAEVLFGIRAPLAGTFSVDGVERRFRNIREAIDAGVHLVPEDRANNAIVNSFSIRDNITFPFLRIFSALGVMKRRKERQKATELVDSIGVKCAGESAPIDSLSGGNQQKVVVARWLVRPSKVLILDEPFQGVDIKSRHDIGEYIRKSAKDGAVIVMATDLDEIIEVADRIVVFNDSKIAGEQSLDALDRDQLLHWAAQSPDEIA